MLEAVTQSMCVAAVPMCCAAPCLQARLLRVYKETAKERHARAGTDAVLAVLRSDYMLHTPTNSLLQV